MVALRNKPVIVLGFHLQDRRLLGVEAGLRAWKSRQESNRNGTERWVMHDGSALSGVGAEQGAIVG